MDGRLRHAAGFLAGGGDTPSPTPTIFWRDIPEGDGNKVAVNSEGKVVVVPYGQYNEDTDDFIRIELVFDEIHIAKDKNQAISNAFEDEWGIVQTSYAGAEATPENFAFTFEGTAYSYDGDENVITPNITETYEP